MQLLCTYKASSGQELDYITLRGHIIPLLGVYTLHCVDTLFPYLGCINHEYSERFSLPKIYTYKVFQRSLTLECGDGLPGVLRAEKEVENPLHLLLLGPRPREVQDHQELPEAGLGELLQIGLLSRPLQAAFGEREATELTKVLLDL